MRSVSDMIAFSGRPPPGIRPPAIGKEQGAPMIEGRANSLIALVQQQDELESSFSNLQMVLKVQVESMQNQILQLERTMISHFGTSDEKTNGFGGLQSDEKAVLAAKRSEERVEKLERMHEQLQAMSSADASALLRTLERRVDKLEKGAELAAAQSHTTDINQLNHSTHVKSLNDLQAGVSEILRWRAGVDSHLADRTQSDMDGDRASDSVKDKTFNTEVVKEAIDKIDAYEFQQSVYDSAFFIGANCLNLSCSVLMGVSFMINMTIQLAVVWFIKEQMTAAPFPREIIEQLAAWRAFQGHSVYRVSDTGSSLASRVCAPDNELSIATFQVNAFAGALQYLDSHGRFLCIISVVLWSFCCAQSLRNSLNFVMAILVMPRSKGNRSEIDVDQTELRMTALSIGRVIFGLFVAVCRLFVGTVLLFYGSKFLAYQDNMPNLLLNASALSFVLDIDQMIFGVTAPSVALGILSSMRPLSLLPVKRTVGVVPYFLLACIVGYTVSINLLYVDDLADQLHSVISTLCAEHSNLNFVEGADALGHMVFAKSVPFKHRSDDMDELFNAQKMVSDLIIHGKAEALVYADDISSNTEDGANVDGVTERVLMHVAELAANGRCIDMPFNTASSSVSKLGARLFVATGNASLKSMTRCADVKHLCTGNNETLLAQNVRFMCPQTCGCADPLSGLWDLATPSSGCPRPDCKHTLISEASQGDYLCEDKSLAELKVSSSWSLMLGRMHELEVINSSVLASISSKGCPALKNLDSTALVNLCQNDGMQGDDFRFIGAGFFCPISCECFIDPSSPLNSSSMYTSSPYVPGGSGLCPRKACKEKYDLALSSKSRNT